MVQLALLCSTSSKVHINLILHVHIIDDVTRHSNYAFRFAAGGYASHVPLLSGGSNGEDTIFSIVKGVTKAQQAYRIIHVCQRN